MWNRLVSPNATPKRGHFLVLRDAAETQVGKVHVPTPEEKNTGVVVAVGEPGFDENSNPVPMLSVGTRIIWESSHRDPIKIDGVDYLLMNDTDYAAVLGGE